MPNFQILEDIVHFDYSQMRALDGKRATDEAIYLFVSLFNRFFESAKEDIINIDILMSYNQYLKNIYNNIDQYEVLFFKRKYQTEFSDYPAETIKYMSDSNSIQNKKNGLQTRLQYWAAGENLGDSIRNPIEHRRLIKNLNKWEEKMSSFSSRL